MDKQKAVDALNRMSAATDEEIALVLNHVASLYGRGITRIELCPLDALLARDDREETALDASSVHVERPHPRKLPAK